MNELTSEIDINVNITFPGKLNKVSLVEKLEHFFCLILIKFIKKIILEL